MVDSQRERKLKAWLALLLTTTVVFLISTVSIIHDCYVFFIQVQGLMFSTEMNYEDRVASTTSRYTFDDVGDFMFSTSVRLFCHLMVYVCTETKLHAVSYWRFNCHLEDVGPMDKF